LLGPYLSGKSTIRHLLASALDLPQCSLNPFEDGALCRGYYRDAGLDEAEVQRLLSVACPDARYCYMKPFEAHAVIQCVEEHPGYIIEIGATHSVYEDERLFQQVRQALDPHRNVILLLPSPDREASYRALRKRYSAVAGTVLIEHFVKHHSNRDLATHTVYTKGNTAEETRDEILDALKKAGSPPTPIILIGPPGVGKSTVARLLAAHLDLPHWPLDVLRWEYYAEIGYDGDLARDIGEHLGFEGVYRYWKPFEAHAVERVLSDHPSGVIDFGAGHSVYESAALFARVQRALASHENVFLLLPSPDPDESVRILAQAPRSTIGGIDANRYLIDHPSNYKLARTTAYTEGKTPEETRDEILALIANSSGVPSKGPSSVDGEKH